MSSPAAAKTTSRFTPCGSSRGARSPRRSTHFTVSTAGHPAERLALKRRLLEPFIKICEAIGYAHSRRVVHRDLKPENVVLGDHGEVIVLDWGLAKLLPEPGGPEATIAGDAIEVSPDASDDKTQGPAGTPRYMAPEQVAADGDRIDERHGSLWAGGDLVRDPRQPPARPRGERR